MQQLPCMKSMFGLVNIGRKVTDWLTVMSSQYSLHHTLINYYQNSFECFFFIELEGANRAYDSKFICHSLILILILISFDLERANVWHLFLGPGGAPGAPLSWVPSPCKRFLTFLLTKYCHFIISTLTDLTLLRNLFHGDGVGRHISGLLLNLSQYLWL